MNQQTKIASGAAALSTLHVAAVLRGAASDFTSHTGYAEAAASRARLEACGGDQDLFLRKECERIDVLFSPLKETGR